MKKKLTTDGSINAQFVQNANNEQTCGDNELIGTRFKVTDSNGDGLLFSGVQFKCEQYCDQNSINHSLIVPFHSV
jgi:hypothetical protein